MGIKIKHLQTLKNDDICLLNDQIKISRVLCESGIVIIAWGSLEITLTVPLNHINQCRPEYTNVMLI